MLGPAPVGADMRVTGVTVTGTSSQVRVDHIHQVRTGLSRVVIGGIILTILIILIEGLILIIIICYRIVSSGLYPDVCDVDTV